MDNLAGALRTEGKLMEAETMARNCLAASERTLGAEHPATCSSASTLADILRDKGDNDAAAALYERALAGLRTNPGATHPTTLGVLYEYSNLRKNQRKIPEARRIGYELIAGARRSLPKDNPNRTKYERYVESLR
jgi:hypothetical protein